MMQNVRLLDCTLRDGGFLNDWNFGEDSSRSIFRRLIKSNIDIIEVGFINGNRSFDINRTINPNTEAFDTLFEGIESNNSKIVAMIDYGTCPIENIAPKKESFLDGIRVIFKKKDMKNAIEFCKELKSKGYEVYTNPVSLTTYSDRDMLNLIELVNSLEPVAMSLVDTYGLLHKDRLFRYFYLLDNNLKKNIEIGYHSHNNFQLAYSNSIELLNIKTNRNLILDSSLYGMGKSAGNCNTELLAMYLNENYGKNYDLSEILNTIDLEILNLLKKFSWGYQISFYLSALNDCHPSYVNFLEKKNMLPIKDINTILSQIDEDKKLSFDEQHIEEIYQNYSKNFINDCKALQELKEKLKDSTILLLGPGKSLKTQQNKIKDFINTKAPIIFSVNHINKLFDVDYIFISNAKRYDQFIDFYTKSATKAKLAVTSNIKDANEDADYILNWAKLKTEDALIGESSLNLLMNLLKRLKVKNVTLAGFDGFSKIANNYYDSGCQFYQQQENIPDVTNAIVKQIGEYQKHLNIEFLTKSSYEREIINV